LVFFLHHRVFHDESYKTGPIMHIFWNLFYIVLTYVVCIVATYVFYIVVMKITCHLVKIYLATYLKFNLPLAPFASLKKHVETLFQLICCERKILFRLKKQALQLVVFFYFQFIELCV